MAQSRRNLRYRARCTGCGLHVLNNVVMCPRCGQLQKAGGNSKRPGHERILGPKVLMLLAALAVASVTVQSIRAAHDEHNDEKGVAPSEPDPNPIAAARSTLKRLVVTEAEFGDQWPFPEYDRGVLGCWVWEGRPVATIQLDGAIYDLDSTSVQNFFLSSPADPWPSILNEFISTGLSQC